MKDTAELILDRSVWIIGGGALGAGVYALCTGAILIALPGVLDLIAAHLCFGIGAIIMGGISLVILAPGEERAAERRAELVASVRDSYQKVQETRAATAARRAELEELEREEEHGKRS